MRNILSFVIGIALATITLIIGQSLTSLTGTAIQISSIHLAELFLLTLMISMVSGYYFGVSMTKDDSNAYLLFSYFSVTLVVTVFSLIKMYDFFISGPLLVVVFGMMIYNNNIDLTKTSGKIFEAISKISLSVVSAGLNSLVIVPFLTPIVGSYSNFAWVWVVVVVIILIVKYVKFPKINI